VRCHGHGDAPAHPLRTLFGPRRSGFRGHALSFGASYSRCTSSWKTPKPKLRSPLTF
jgi:hypothetical protein